MFVVLLTYTVPLAKIDAHVSAHREFLAHIHHFDPFFSAV